MGLRENGWRYGIIGGTKNNNETLADGDDKANQASGNTRALS